MSEAILSRTLFSICVCVSVYIAWIVFANIGSVYTQALDWSAGSNIIALLISLFVSASVASSFTVAFLIYRQRRTWVLFPLSVHVFLVVVGYASTTLVVAVFIWWWARHAYPAT